MGASPTSPSVALIFQWGASNLKATLGINQVLIMEKVYHDAAIISHGSVL